MSSDSGEGDQPVYITGTNFAIKDIAQRLAAFDEPKFEEPPKVAAPIIQQNAQNIQNAPVPQNAQNAQAVENQNQNQNPYSEACPPVANANEDAVETANNNAFYIPEHEESDDDIADFDRFVVKERNVSKPFFFEPFIVVAAKKRKFSSVEYILQNDGDINEQDAKGNTALLVAVENFDREMVNFLVRKGADVNRANKNGWTPLHQACYTGMLPIVKFLIKHGAKINALDSDAFPAIFYAAVKDEFDVVKYLISKGAYFWDVDLWPVYSAKIRSFLDNGEYEGRRFKLNINVEW